MTNIEKVSAIESALIRGDLSKLTEQERVSYYHKLCSDLGLNPLTNPFAYITLNGKLTLYALKAATDQLRSSRKVSVQIVARENIADCYVVTARASLPDGRVDESTGAVPIKGLTGEKLANALLKCETKAKRRVTLSICGLGMLDESEAESIPNAAKQVNQPRIVASNEIELPPDTTGWKDEDFAQAFAELMDNLSERNQKLIKEAYAKANGDIEKLNFIYLKALKLPKV